MARARRETIAVAVALLATGVVLSLVAQPPRPVPASAPDEAAALALPPPPALPSALFADEAPDSARASNAAVPLVAGKPVAAPAFRYAGTEVDRAAAEGCLTAAVLYEAGDDPPGERAVAQVVLNRLRHPLFPKTVCGVILQGSERRTGCQFTFTCDGSLARQPSAAGWRRAGAIAKAALAGYVYRPVGTATHYHTDWVVPYWRASLAKIAVVHTQIFYRWPGPWGSRAVLTGRIEPGEAPGERIARLAGIGTEDGSPLPEGPAAPAAMAVAGVPPAALNGSIVRLKDEDAGQFVLQLNPAAPAGYALAAASLCGDKLDCTVYGWTGAQDLPRALPVTPPMMRALAFAYRKSKALGLAQSYWDCHRFPRPSTGECFTD